MRTILVLLLACSTAAGCGGEDERGTWGGGGPDGGAIGAGGSVGGGGSGGDVGGAGSTGGAGGEGGAGFVLEVHTELDVAGVLTLRTNLPRDASACRVVGAPCLDDDGDGLNDAWEDVALDRLRPFLRLDEAEQLVNDTRFTTAMVGRVTPVEPYLHVYIMLGYAKDFGSCGGFTSHNGDSERVVLELEPLDEGAGDARVRRAYTAAHEGTPTDHGMVFADAALTSLVYEIDADHGEPRWVVFPSADKHATYATLAICEGIAPGIPCFDEDCGPDGVADPSPFTLLPPFGNAGEPTLPLLTDLASLGFSGEDAWLDQDFCGGLGGIGCASSVLEKLTVDPF